MIRKVPYVQHRSQIRSGDLLVWSKNPRNKLSNLLLFIIKLFTQSTYAHVGIAWKVGKRLFVIEATMPQVRIIPVSEREEFYHIPLNIEWKKDYEVFLLDKIGLDYSVFDAINAFLGKRLEKDDRWQCAELANEFYRSIGIELGNAYTPGDLVESVLETQGTSIYKIRISK